MSFWVVAQNTAQQRSAKKDLTAVKVGEDWYNVAQNRNKWSVAWSQNLEEHQQEQ